jgi:hypothetical protein
MHAAQRVSWGCLDTSTATRLRRTCMEAPMRTRGSARFAPYFKVQTFEPYCTAWVDIQRAFPTIEAARAALPPGKQARIMRITERGREPITV